MSIHAANGAAARVGFTAASINWEAPRKLGA